MALQEELEVQGNFLFRYRSYLPLVLLVAGVGVFVWHKQTVTSPDDYAVSYPYAAAFICLFGLLIRIFTVGYTPKNTSGRNTKAGQVADTLNTSGIYSTVRHPLYVGNYFMWLGAAVMTEQFWFMLVFTLGYQIYYERIMFAEEQFLRRKFGQVYLDWAVHTPAFIPSFKHFRPSDLSFSIKKVLKKEKNGLAAIFLIIFAFQYLGNYLETGSYALVWNVWTYAFLISVLLYFILKVLKKYTSVLHEEGR